MARQTLQEALSEGAHACVDAGLDVDRWATSVAVALHGDATGLEVRGPGQRIAEESLHLGFGGGTYVLDGDLVGHVRQATEREHGRAMRPSVANGAHPLDLETRRGCRASPKARDRSGLSPDAPEAPSRRRSPCRVRESEDPWLDPERPSDWLPNQRPMNLPSTASRGQGSAGLDHSLPISACNAGQQCDRAKALLPHLHHSRARALSVGLLNPRTRVATRPCRRQRLGLDAGCG